MKKIITYFSAQGTTANVAKNIAKILGADIFEIEPKQKYTNEDLDWTNKNSRSSLEMRDKSSRPEIKNKVQNLAEYETVVIGFPVWWYTAPTIINTFIEQNKLEGKNIYVFVTSGGSGVEGSLSDLKKTYPNLNFISGKRLRGSESETEIKDWIK